MRLVRIAAVLSFLVMISILTLAPATEAADGADKNPCAMKNPCSMKDKMKNPCDMKVKAMPAGGATPVREMAIKDAAKLTRKGNALWADASLGTAGLSCSTCHPGGAGLKSTPWPKFIAMADDTLTVDQMINFCMTNPMKAEPLAWNSQKITALAAYVAANSGKGGEAVNPCAAKQKMKNPCDMKNPCAAKDKMKNPCGMK